MRAALGLVAACCACSFPRPTEEEADGFYGCIPGFVDFCEEPRGTLQLEVAAPMTINTDTDSRCRVAAQPGGPDVCGLFFKRVVINLDQKLLIQGSRPVAIVAAEEILIYGTLDVAGHHDGSTTDPPAGSRMSCSSVSSPGDETAGGGGAGGSFATEGGNGGDGRNNATRGGRPGLISTITVLQGGCAGQTGGKNSTSSLGRGGYGGGGLYLAAPTMRIAGVIHAGGGGGLGGGQEGQGGGGGGGGSGGLIVMQAARFTATDGSILLSTGGGGGQGGSINSSGTRGEDAIKVHYAAGGAIELNAGGYGGDGALANFPGMVGSNHSAGGGGGGGGTGYIRLYARQAIIAPLAKLVPSAEVIAQ